MKVEEFLQDPSSTTGYFQSLSKNYKLDILHHGRQEDSFWRIVAIYLDNIPVMIGVSSTQVWHHTFLEILENAAHIPIGTRLFKAGAEITRTNMQIGEINCAAITNNTVTTFLHKLDGIGTEIYLRQSDFVHKNETMHLDEYVLPGLIQLVTAQPRER